MSNANKSRNKEISITLNDGVKRTLRYDLNALAELEDLYGSADAAFKKTEKGSIKTLRDVLWVGLLHAEPNLTSHDVGALIDINDMQGIVDQVGLAIGADMPDKETVAKVKQATVPNA
jgi:hypothetical protein